MAPRRRGGQRYSPRTGGVQQPALCNTFPMYPIDMQRAFRSLSKLRPHVVKWTGSSGVMQQMLTDGEADLVAIANGRMEGIQKAGVPAGFTFNQQMILSNYWLVPKGARNATASVSALRARRTPAPWTPTPCI